MNKMVRAHYNVRVAKFLKAFAAYAHNMEMGSMITPAQFSERMHLWAAVLAAHKDVGRAPPSRTAPKKQAPV